MLKLTGKILLFLGLNVLLLGILLGFMNRQVEKHDFNNWTTEANLLHIPADKNFDLLILGTSHARSLARARNHLRMEKILGRDIINLSQGLGGGGLLNQFAFLKYFYKQDNTADTIVYFIDPFVFYNPYFDSKDELYVYEPARFGFFSVLLNLGFDPGVIYTYLYSKFTERWLGHHPFSWKSESSQIENINAVSVFKRYNVVYPNDLDEEVFRDKSALFERITAYIDKKQNHNLIFVVPPGLIEWPGHDNMISLLKEIKIQYGIPYYDFSDSMKELEYYKDHDHLNTKGVEYFTRNYLKPLFEEPSKTPPHNHQ